MRDASRRFRGLTIGFIGAGTMGQALMRGLLAQGVSPRAIRATDANPQTRARVRRQLRIQATGRNADVARRADVVILAVKPPQFPEVVGELTGVVRPRQLVISIAAGITLRWLEQRLPRVPVVRAMPNLPATVGCGFAAIAGGRFASARHRAVANTIFRAVGEAVELPERHFDAITAVSGSGPAYVFFLIRMWETAAHSLGLSDAVARRAVAKTLEGSERLWQRSGEPAEALIRKVASKRGTTEAALKILARRRVARHFVEALGAAARRSKELSR